MDQSQTSASERALPESFESIQDIMDISNDRLRIEPLVNFIGFVKDFRPPFQTRGTDFKCTLEMMDVSRQFHSSGIQLVIFRPENKMPAITPGAADILLLRKVKVQMWSGTISLLSHFTTEFHLLPAKSIPTSPNPTMYKLWKSYPSSARSPTNAQTDYVLWAHANMDKSFLPTAEAFQERSMQAMAVRDKFSLLKDVQLGKFYNVIGQVVKMLDRVSGQVTMYVSDYTHHPNFYHYTWAGRNEPSEGVDGDEFGYLSHQPKNTKEWPGPYGKMVIQITLYDWHADYAREHVKADQWVMLRNLYVTYGKSGGCLEGFLRGENGQSTGQVKVEIMKTSAEPDDNDVRWKEGLRRKLLWWMKFEDEKKAILEEGVQSGTKRKREHDGASKLNGKERRKEKRAAAQKKATEDETKEATRLDLNENVRCNHPDKSAIPLLEIMRGHLSKSSSGQKYQLPFVNCNYRADVRVVDFFPARLEDFAVGRRVSEYEILSDYSGGEDTDHEEDMRQFKEGKGFGEKKWEWRFALQVEDASAKSSTTPKERMWLVVEHKDAQMLLGIDDDATNLRRNPDLLSQVRERLCILWGDLEEQKTASLPKETVKESKNIPTSSIESIDSTFPQRKAGDQPDLDSDVEDSIQQKRKQKRLPLKERDMNSIVKTVNEDVLAKKEFAVRNKAFTCCIKQYGIRVAEEDVAKATAGKGQRWERVFGLHGTMIM